MKSQTVRRQLIPAPGQPIRRRDIAAALRSMAQSLDDPPDLFAQNDCAFMMKGFEVKPGGIQLVLRIGEEVQP